MERPRKLEFAWHSVRDKRTAERPLGSTGSFLLNLHLYVKKLYMNGKRTTRKVTVEQLRASQGWGQLTLPTARVEVPHNT